MSSSDIASTYAQSVFEVLFEECLLTFVRPSEGDDANRVGISLCIDRAHHFFLDQSESYVPIFKIVSSLV
jgi:hypothetical protein